MKKMTKMMLCSATSILGLSTFASIGLMSTSCKSIEQPRNAAIKLFNNYNKEINSLTNNTKYATSKNANDIIDVTTKYEKLADILIFGSKNKSVDEQIWAETIKYQIETDMQSIKSKAYLLGAPIGGDICSSYGFFLSDALNNAQNLIDNNKNFGAWKSLISETIGILEIVMTNFSNAIDLNVSLSGIMTRMLVSKMFKDLFATNLISYLTKGIGAQEINKDNWKTILGKCDCFNNLVQQITPGIISEDERKELITLVLNLDNKINDFTDFMLNNYWKKVDYGWAANDEDKIFKLSVIKKEDSKEVTNSYEVPSDQPYMIEGLGLTKDNMNTKDIGIGFMNDKAKTIGLDIYNYILRKDTTLDKTALDINNEGQKLVHNIYNNMQNVGTYLANKLAKDKGEWKPEGFSYNKNIYSDEQPVKFDKTIAKKDENGNWKVEMDNFFEWLNSEQWYFGRDVLDNQVITIPKEISGLSTDTYYVANQNEKTISIEQVEKNKYSRYVANPQYAEYLGSSKITGRTSNKFGDAGDLYEQWVKNQKGIKPGIQGKWTISGEQAFAGATFALDTYNRWRNAVYPKVQTIFTKSNDSNVFAPNKLILNTKIITGVGGAAYANGDTFYLDVNPYFGLQKWSMTTLASHESLPGHNLQMIYAVDNTSDKENAPQFSYTSYAEGWGLFSEWLVTQYGSYGKPHDIKDWTNQEQRLLMPDFDNNNFSTKNKDFSTVNINVVKANKETMNGKFSNGIYETKFGEYNPSEQPYADSLDQGYYNAMQYFGFLNERQLRAMRMVLDTSIHVGGPKLDDKGKIIDDKCSCKGEKGTGWSLNDEIKFMGANSALGQGDRTREAQRYLNYVGQATSYMTGETVVEGLFANASYAYAKKHNNALFLNYADLESTRNNTAPFFNLFLRNNDIPLQILIKFVNKYIQEKIGQLPSNALN